MASSGFASSSASLSSSTSSSAQINSNSILVALLDSHYTELAELVEKAMLLHTLEQAVATHNLTIFAPINEALEHHLHPDFKHFLLQPRNLPSLQSLLLFHIIPARIQPAPVGSTRHQTLSNSHFLHLTRNNGTTRDWTVNQAKITHTRPDGIIHGIDRLLVPRSVQDDFNRRRSLQSITAVKPEGAPELDPVGPTTTSTAKPKSRISFTRCYITVGTTKWPTFW